MISNGDRLCAAQLGSRGGSIMATGYPYCTHTIPTFSAIPYDELPLKISQKIFLIQMNNRGF